jgi:hypothetical protein
MICSSAHRYTLDTRMTTFHIQKSSETNSWKKRNLARHNWKRSSRYGRKRAKQIQPHDLWREKLISTLAQRGLEVPSYMVPSSDEYLATFATFSHWFLSSSKGQPLLVVEVVAKAKIVLYYASGVLVVVITQLQRMKSIPDWRTEKLNLMFAQHKNPSCSFVPSNSKIRHIDGIQFHVSLLKHFVFELQQSN